MPSTLPPPFLSPLNNSTKSLTARARGATIAPFTRATRAAVALLALPILGAACGGSPPTVQSPVVAPVASSAEPRAVSDAPPLGAAAAAWNDPDASIPVSSRDPSTGNRDALVTLVVFSDFQCPFCARAVPTLAQIRETYPNDELRIVWKHLPLPMHTNAKPAAEAAQGVFEMSGSAAFWRFHDAAFSNQSDLSRDNYIKWAKDAGVVDLTAFASALDDHRWAYKVDEDMALAQAAGANGTPTFFANGVELSGAQPFSSFKTLIDSERANALAALNRGTPRDRLYATISQEHKRTPPHHDDKDADDRPDTTVWKIPVDSQPVRGAKTALVTIVEFADFQCPYCAKVEATLDKVRAKYGADLRIVWRNDPLPFHPRAMPAAELAAEARAQKGDAGFWAVHDALFASHLDLDDAALDAIAAKAGLDLTRTHAALKSEKHKAAILDDVDIADDFKASGTPHFFINGRRLLGAQPMEKFEALIDDELVNARALVAKGIAPAKVYETLTKSGEGPVPLEKKIVSLPANLPSRGNPAAKVTIQEFADFQCPFCGRAESTLAEVMKTYGSRVRIVWRDLPLPMHPAAPLAAQAAAEAFSQQGSAGFWKIHDLMMKNQTDLSRATLDGYAQQLGLDVAKWTLALDTGTHKAAIDADAAAATNAQISGTPFFIINGYALNGAQPYSKFRKIIEQALRDAGPTK